MSGSQLNYRNRISIFGPFLSSKGLNYAPCEALSEKLERSGWKVIKASNRINKVARLVDMIYTAWKYRNSYQVAAVEVYSGYAFFWAEAVCFILRLAKKPYVITLHGGNLPEFSKKFPKRIKSLFKSAAKVTTPSRYLLEKMKHFRSDLLLIPNPITISKYPFRLRRKIRPNIVWLRAFHNIYNPGLAPRVVKSLYEKKIDVRLSMIGPDKGDGSFENVKKLSEKLKVIDRIKFIGKIGKEQVPYYLEPNDIFINTTYIDNTPISVMEAMACGLCIVSTNVGGIPYLLNHEKDALLVPADDSKKMAECVHRILTENGLSEQLSRNARNKAMTFSWEHVLPMWEQLLESLR